MLVRNWFFFSIISFVRIDIKETHCFCRCDDGRVSPCIRESLDAADSTDRSDVLTVLLVIMMILVALIVVFGGAIYYLR